MNKNLKKKLKHISIVFMDVDGVLTDGSAFFIDGRSPKRWNVKDRLAVKILTSLKQENLKVIWISGRDSKNLQTRAKELGVTEAHSGVGNKVPLMKKICGNYNIDPRYSMYIGDDLVDLACISFAGVSCCPSDAVSEVKERVDYIATLPGGRGAVREIIKEILKIKGYWDKIVNSYTEV